MRSWLELEGLIRLTLWLSLLVSLLFLEWRIERVRAQSFAQTEHSAITQKRTRWLANFGLAFVDMLMLRLLFPVLAVGFAFGNSLGILHWLDWPMVVETLLALLLLDCAIYWQHRFMHALPWLWRLHAVHHSDQHFDTTLALRFHPIEIALSMTYKIAVIALIGASAEAVAIFELMLALGALLTHTNLQLPEAIERVVSRFWITPSMHRVHHSVEVLDQHKNFGTLLCVWDRWFGSYQKKAEQSRPFGLQPQLDTHAASLFGLLKLPFRRLFK